MQKVWASLCLPEHAFYFVGRADATGTSFAWHSIKYGFVLWVPIKAWRHTLNSLGKPRDNGWSMRSAACCTGFNMVGLIMTHTATSTVLVNEALTAVSHWSFFNPFTATACKISGQKKCMDAPANTVVFGPLSPTFSAVPFDKSPFTHTNAKKKSERLKGLKCCTLIDHFHLTLW